MKRKPHNAADRKKVYAALHKAAKKGYALNWREIAAMTGLEGKTVGVLKSLEKDGLAHIVGKDKKRLPVWWPGAKTPALPFTNPSPGVMLHGPHASADQRKAAMQAEKDARRWFQDESLVTEAKTIRSYKAPTHFVEVGTLVSVCYRSNKYDGKERDWEHEFTKKRRLFISPDGSTMVVFPPFQFTKQGIKG